MSQIVSEHLWPMPLCIVRYSRGGFDTAGRPCRSDLPAFRMPTAPNVASAKEWWKGLFPPKSQG